MSMMPIAAALGCAAIMGAAIQRGGTCTVAAIEDLLARRRPLRLFAMLEAALWVTALLILAQASGADRMMMSIGYPFTAGYAVAAGTLVGACALGLGAVVNGACAFGTVARLGAGELSFLATPIGFFAAALLMPVLLPGTLSVLRADSSIVLGAPAWAGGVLMLALLARLSYLRHDRTTARRDLRAHLATIVIGITFVVLILVAGAWTYTDALAQLAHGRSMDLGQQVALTAALFAGAFFAGRQSAERVHARLHDVPRRFGGGLLMGVGAFLVPGSNDALVLLGMPLLWPHAWLAFGAMALTIAAVLQMTRARYGVTPP